jgi:hypothetical protein
MPLAAVAVVSAVAEGTVMDVPEPDAASVNGSETSKQTPVSQPPENNGPGFVVAGEYDSPRPSREWCIPALGENPLVHSGPALVGK